MECAWCNTQEKAYGCVSPFVRMQAGMGGEYEGHRKWICFSVLIKITAGHSRNLLLKLESTAECPECSRCYLPALQCWWLKIA